MHQRVGGELLQDHGHLSFTYLFRIAYLQELQRSSKVQCLCLDVFAAYIDWIDLQYVANDTILQLISQRIHNEDTFEV